MPATSVIPHAVRPNRHARPLALTFTTPLLLAENSWTEPAAFTLGVRVETPAIRATRVTVTLQAIPGYPGYRHFGIND